MHGVGGFTSPVSTARPMDSYAAAFQHGRSGVAVGVQYVALRDLGVDPNRAAPAPSGHIACHRNNRQRIVAYGRLRHRLRMGFGLLAPRRHLGLGAAVSVTRLALSGSRLPLAIQGSTPGLVEPLRIRVGNDECIRGGDVTALAADRIGAVLVGQPCHQEKHVWAERHKHFKRVPDAGVEVVGGRPRLAAFQRPRDDWMVGGRQPGLLKLTSVQCIDNKIVPTERTIFNICVARYVSLSSFSSMYFSIASLCDIPSGGVPQVSGSARSSAAMRSMCPRCHALKAGPRTCCNAKN